MTERPTERNRPTSSIAIAAVVHAAMLVAIFHSEHFVRVRPSLPGSPNGARIELTYLPSKDSISAPHMDSKRALQTATRLKPTQLTVKTPVPTQIAADSQPRPSDAGGAASNDALGNENIQIALTTYSPSPKPDLSALPHGSQGDVVVDITIDPEGKVADLQILQTLGYGIDGPVAETVRGWKFRPATKDGVPVASVQELHFHFGPV